MLTSNQSTFAFKIERVFIDKGDDTWNGMVDNESNKEQLDTSRVRKVHAVVTGTSSVVVPFATSRGHQREIFEMTLRVRGC